MGYLEQYLRNNPAQVVDANDIYPLVLRVRHSKDQLHLISVAETSGTVSLLVKQAVPDVEDWQYTGDTGEFYIFRFHNFDQRDTARENLEALGYTVEIKNFLKSGSRELYL
jgi:hypothetical protein